MEICCVSHLHNNVRGQRAASLQDTPWNSGLIAYYHHNCHGLTDRTADSKDNTCQDSGSCSGKQREEHASLMAGSKRKSALIIAVRYRADRSFRNFNDRWKDHESEKERSRQDTLASASESILYPRYNHNQSKETVNDRRDTCHQFDGRF